ncbi:MAG: ERF family protein [Planctomycetota bacterium]
MDTFNKSEAIDQLATALSQAQGEIVGAQMNSVNPFFKSKYADLGAVIEAAKPALLKNGLAVSQLLTSTDGRIGLTTILMHKSGQWISAEISMPLESEKGRSLSQSIGASITYLRRYAYAAIVGVYSDEDNDGTGTAIKAQPAIDWVERVELVKSVAEVGYFGGDEKRAVAALKYLQDNKKITPALDDKAILVIVNKAATKWADEKAAKDKK